MAVGERAAKPWCWPTPLTNALARPRSRRLSPEAFNLDDDNHAKLQAVANKEPLALIEYWAVVSAPLKTGLRKVCVRVVDVFGFATEVVGVVEPSARLA